MLSAGLFAHKPIVTFDLPNIPPGVDLTKLDENGRTMSSNERDALNALHLKDGRYSKRDVNAKSTIAVIDHVPHSVLGKVINEGANVKVKPVQNAQTGEWSVCKISSNYTDSQNESLFLNKMGLLAEGDYLNKETFHSTKSHHNKKSLFMRYVPGIALSSIDFANRPAHQLMQFITQLVCAFKELVKQGIVHNKMHSGNIIYDYINNKMHVIDFALAHEVDEKGFTDFPKILNFADTWASKNEWLKENLCPFLQKLKEIDSNTNNTGQLVDANCNEILSELSRLDKMLPENEKAYQIGILEVNDYKNHHPELTDLEKYAEVWLVDTRNEATIADYVKCRQDLQKCKIWVGDKVFKDESMDRLDAHVSTMFKARHPGCNLTINNLAENVLAEKIKI